MYLLSVMSEELNKVVYKRRFSWWEGGVGVYGAVISMHRFCSTITTSSRKVTPFLSAVLSHTHIDMRGFIGFLFLTL